MSDNSYPISLFTPNPWNFNILTNEELQTLANDIKANGIQQKIVVRSRGDGFEIVDGYHKVKALKLNGVREIQFKDIEIRKLTDGEVRGIVRSLKVRGSRKNLIKEAQLYKIDFEESGLTQQSYAEKLNMDQGNLSKIIKRATAPIYPNVQQILMDTEIPSDVIDEILTARPDYHLQLITRAKEEHWSGDDARQAVKLGVAVDGSPIKSKTSKSDIINDITKLDMYDRVALSTGLNDIATSIAKVARYAKARGAPRTADNVEQLLVKLYKVKNVVEGNRTVYRQDGSMSKMGELINWFSKGSDEEKRGKISEVEKRVQEMIR